MDFVTSVLPWLVLGLLAGYAFARIARLRSGSEDGGSRAPFRYLVGLMIGIALGVLIGAASGNLALWMPAGLLLGLILGTVFSRRSDS